MEYEFTTILIMQSHQTQGSGCRVLSPGQKTILMSEHVTQFQDVDPDAPHELVETMEKDESSDHFRWPFVFAVRGLCTAALL